MKCPRDETILEPLDYEAGIYVDGCPACGGMWLGKGKLEKIEEITEHDYTENLSKMPDLLGGAFEVARQKMDQDPFCPKCGVQTESTEYAYCSQVVINRCPDCGGLQMESRNIRAGFLLSLLKSEEGGINKK
jgi:Zn-finger nucleic acid-binding protein